MLLIAIPESSLNADELGLTVISGALGLGALAMPVIDVSANVETVVVAVPAAPAGSP
jgi:hypothetical protein